MQGVIKNKLHEILLAGKKHQLPKGQIVHVFDDRMAVNMVKKGYIKRYIISDDGAQSIQVIYGPGDIFPLTPIFKNIFNLTLSTSGMIVYYETLTESISYSISSSELEDAINKDPLLYKELFEVSGERLRSNIHRLENIAIKGARSRLAHQLVHFARIFGQETSEGIEIQVPLTHQTLANSLNLARETVSLDMAKLQRKGILSAKKNILIKDIQSLEKLI